MKTMSLYTYPQNLGSYPQSYTQENGGFSTRINPELLEEGGEGFTDIHAPTTITTILKFIRNRRI